MLHVRTLSSSDMDALMTLAERMHAESGFRQYRLDVERTVYVILTLTETSVGAYVKGAFDEMEMVGFMVGEVQLHPFVDMLQAVDHAFYVRPESRQTTAAVRLVRDFETWARMKGAQRIQLGAAAGVDNERASAFLAAAGLPHYGAIHVKEIA